MKKIFVVLTLIFLGAASSAIADAKFQLEKVNNTEALPKIDIDNIKDNSLNKMQPENKPIESQKVKPAFNPKKNSGLTNYQYDDSYYKYNKYEKFIKDNIDYSKSGSTKLH